MTPAAPRAWGEPVGTALFRCAPEDFQVTEELGFEPDGEGEHAFLYLQKRGVNTLDLVAQVARLAGVPRRDVGYSGLKDRDAVTRQWLSVGLAGRAAPDWTALQEAGDVQVLAATRHSRKLRRGVHRANRFRLVLRQWRGDRGALDRRLAQLGSGGVPNYFGEQRFGRGGSTLAQAHQWRARNGRLPRDRRGLYLSALRAELFNGLLAQRVAAATWDRVLPGDTCLLHGSGSFFLSEQVDDALAARAVAGDVHPGLPLWGRWDRRQAGEASWRERIAPWTASAGFLERSGLDLAWRPARLLPDDFCWEFCDDGSLQLDFALGAGGYATALLAECVHYKKGTLECGIGSEQG